MPPDFQEQRVYSHGAMKQLRYQSLRFRAMLHSPGYFNRVPLGHPVGRVLPQFRAQDRLLPHLRLLALERGGDRHTLVQYDWERAPDTKTTWRIGDGTAAFYNYVYYTVAGFTEHDTFRSNQIREGDLTREEALEMVREENTPRYQNIKWYLDVLGFDFTDVITTVNGIPRLH